MNRMIFTAAVAALLVASPGYAAVPFATTEATFEVAPDVTGVPHGVEQSMA